MRLNAILFLLFASLLSLQASSSSYFGIVGVGGYNKLSQDVYKPVGGGSSTDIDPILYGLKINMGIDNGEELRTNFVIGVERFDTDVYATADGGSSTGLKLLYSVGLDIIGTFNKGSSMNPYIKGGLDYSFMKTSSYVQDWPGAVGFNLGGGSYFKSSDTLELQLGAYYKYRMWGNYNLDIPNTTNVSLSDHSIMVELGINFHY